MKTEERAAAAAAEKKKNEAEEEEDKLKKMKRAEKGDGIRKRDEEKEIKRA